MKDHSSFHPSILTKRMARSWREWPILCEVLG